VLKPALLEVSELSFGYGRRVVLRGVSFKATGGLNAIAGANGSGKSTLLRLVATARIPPENHVRVDGVDPSHRRERSVVRAKISYLPQVTRQDVGLTVRSWIEFGGWLQRIDGKALSSLTSRAVEEWELGEFAGQRLKTLSVGQRRRADLARACMNPSTTLLILDEPFAALDRDVCELAQRIIKERSGRATVVLSDPSLAWSEARLLAQLSSA
jgi:ABC-2 type transport system ATP-binding protein